MPGEGYKYWMDYSPSSCTSLRASFYLGIDKKKLSKHGQFKILDFEENI